jgi:glycosyltransferase involved in cell wall biosynthesis
MSASPELWFLHPFRLPSEHAHGIQILHTCDALAEAGTRVRLPVKRNPERPVASVAEALARYGLAPRDGLRIDWLPTRHKGVSGLWLRAKIRTAPGKPVFYVRHLRLAPGAARRGPVIVELHGLERETARAVAAADAIVSISETLAAEIRARFAPTVPVVVIPDAADPGVFRAVTAPGPPRAVYLGQLMPWKGVEVLLHALARVPDLPALVVGGRDGEDPRRDALKRMADQLGLRDRIEWTGWLPAAAAWQRLRAGDMGIVPTRAGDSQELSTSPLKLFEYLASGLPVIASDLPALREIVREGENGMLFAEGDADALAATLASLAADPARRRRLSAGALKGAAERSWAARARQIQAVVSRVGTKRDGGPRAKAER